MYKELYLKQSNWKTPTKACSLELELSRDICNQCNLDSFFLFHHVFDHMVWLEFFKFPLDFHPTNNIKIASDGNKNKLTEQIYIMSAFLEALISMLTNLTFVNEVFELKEILIFAYFLKFWLRKFCFMCYFWLRK